MSRQCWRDAARLHGRLRGARVSLTAETQKELRVAEPRLLQSQRNAMRGFDLRGADRRHVAREESHGRERRADDHVGEWIAGSDAEQAALRLPG